ncbi:MAG TPA: serine hydrolase domain-containing protein [Steroidobacteraceae bacterium]|nr:serine hydrolase domain-containing protein [Steroidobacteraceae bacterium]
MIDPRRLLTRPQRVVPLMLLALSAGAVYAQSASPVPPESVGLSARRLERLDRYLESQIVQRRKAGAVVLVARHGRIAWEKAYGAMDLASGVPMRADAIFRLFSMTKPVTSVALLTLYEQGKFQLTDPLEMYLPAFRDVRVLAGVDARGEMILESPRRKVTIQDLFRHTAGLAYGGYFEATPVDKAYQADGIVYARLDSLSELVQKIAREPLLYQPGERWVYSFSHDVLAWLVEYFSGMSFDAYCRKAIFEPLGMKDTVFGMPAGLAARYPTLYGADAAGALAATGPEADPYRHLTGRPFGGVGLASTARDYLRFAQMLLGRGALGGVRILAPKTVELMTSDNLPPGTEYWQPGVRFGLGVAVVTDPAQAGIIGSKGAFGWPGAASTWVDIDPKEDLVALLMVQYFPRDLPFDAEFHTLVYQAIVR